MTLLSIEIVIRVLFANKYVPFGEGTSPGEYSHMVSGASLALLVWLLSSDMVP